MAQRIKELRIKNNKTLLQLAEAIGVSEGTVQRYESGNIRNLKYDTIVALANALNTTPAYLMGWEGNGDFAEMIGKSARSLPIMGTICAGTGVVCEDDTRPRFVIDVEVDADFALRVQGDSMKDAEIYDQDIIFIKRNVDLINNYIYAVELLLTNEAVLRKVSLVNGSLILTPCNPDYDPVIAAPDDVRIIGKCVGVYHGM